MRPWYKREPLTIWGDLRLASLTPLARLVHASLLDQAWGLPEGIRRPLDLLRNGYRLSEGDAASTWGELRELWSFDEGTGGWYWPPLEEQREELSRLSEQGREHGRQGGRPVVYERCRGAALDQPCLPWD